MQRNTWPTAFIRAPNHKNTLFNRKIVIGFLRFYQLGLSPCFRPGAAARRRPPVGGRLR